LKLDKLATGLLGPHDFVVPKDISAYGSQQQISRAAPRHATAELPDPWDLSWETWPEYVAFTRERDAAEEDDEPEPRNRPQSDPPFADDRPRPIYLPGFRRR